MKNIIKYNGLIDAIVVNRPSKINKSPYLIDIKINGKIEMCHSPGLGLSGLIRPGIKIRVLPIECDGKSKRCSKYTVEKVLVEEKEIRGNKTWLGANPIRANLILFNTIKKQIFERLKDVTITHQEYTIGNSRLDFRGNDTKGNEVFIEVKNVVVADYHISTAPRDRKIFYTDIEKKNYKRIGVFPDGKTKPGNTIVSPRAYKHLFELEKISKRNKKRAILIFILQRSDCTGFVPNYVKDPTYSNKLYDLINNSKVEVYVLSYKWRKDTLYFCKELPILDKSGKYYYGKIPKNKKN